MVDNTNMLARERAKYIALAKPAGYKIIGYFFASQLQEALERNRQREGKALIPEKGMVAKYRAMQRPGYSEGFDRLYYVTIAPNQQFLIHDWLEGQDRQKLII